MYHLQQKIFNIFKILIENFSVRGEGRRGKGACLLRAQVLRLAASRIRPLVLSLKELGALIMGGRGVGKQYYTGMAETVFGCVPTMCLSIKEGSACRGRVCLYRGDVCLERECLPTVSIQRVILLAQVIVRRQPPRQTDASLRDRQKHHPVAICHLYPLFKRMYISFSI